MKIAFIGQKGIPALSGGVEKHVEKLAVRMARYGHEVTVYVRPHYTNKMLREFRGVRLVHLPTLPTKHLDAIVHSFLATLHAVFLRRYDVIHYHSIGPSILTFIPRLLKPGSRVIATFHSRDYLHQKWSAPAQLFLKMAEFFTCKVPEKTVVISECLKAYAEKAYQKEFTYIPNGAEIENESDPTYLKEWGLKPGRYILAVSRLVRHKGVHYLIKAFRELEDKSKIPNNMKLVIVGAPANTQEYADYLKLISTGSPNVIFTGEQHGRILASLFSHAALFVQPSEDEGLSLALLEAMGHGVMPLVSDIGPNLEAIGHGSGDAFENKNILSLVEKLAYYVNRPAESKAFGEAARERIYEHYSWDAITRRTLEVYGEMLHKHAPGKKPLALYRHR